MAYEEIYKFSRYRFPEPFGTYQVHHKDGNKLNNDVSNLELMSREEHMYYIHGVQNALYNSRKPYEPEYSE
ncbi:MAG: HNH endonuclease [Candidatus Woesearchaeota archaeon]